MVGELLLLCGATLAVLATWRGYVAARSVLGPLVHEGDPTRAALRAAGAPLGRSRVRAAAVAVARAVGWLALAMYGLYLLSVAWGLG